MSDCAAVSHCGFAALLGRPNVGKSTLLNALVGEKISITANRRQTTRAAVRGATAVGRAQIILVDCPGWQSVGGGVMNRKMRDCAERQIPRADALIFVIDAKDAGRADDYRLLSRLPPRIPAIAAINKVDLVRDKNRLLPLIADLAGRRDFAAIVPISARKNQGLLRLGAEIGKLLPESPPLFDASTDADERAIAAEFLREKLTRYLGAELPHALAVTIADWRRESDGMIRIEADVIVERESQKAIVVGGGGEAIKRASTAARVDLERRFRCKVFLRARVRVRRGWRDDPGQLARFGVGAG